MRDFSDNSRETADQISDLVNSTLLNAEEVGVLLSSQHRTLQQNFMRVAVSFIKAMAEAKKSGYYDLRNQASCELAEQMMDVTEESYLPHI